MGVHELVRRALRRWPPHASRVARIEQLRRMNARTRDKVAATHELVLETERPIGQEPSLLELEWFEHRVGSRTDDPGLARDCGLAVGPGPADLEVLVLYGDVAALLEPRPGQRPRVVVIDPDGTRQPTATGPIEPLPADLEPFLDGVAALSVESRTAILRVRASRAGDHMTYVGISGGEPERDVNPTIDRNLGRRAEKAYARLRHDRILQGEDA